MGLQGRLWQLWSGDNGGTGQGWTSVVLMVPEIESRRALSCQKQLCVSSSSTVPRQMAQEKEKVRKVDLGWRQQRRISYLGEIGHVHVKSLSGLSFSFYGYSLVWYDLFRNVTHLQKRSDIWIVSKYGNDPLFFLLIIKATQLFS